LVFPEDRIPTFTKIAEFIKPIFDKLCIQNECLLMMLIYIERIITEGNLNLNKENWRPVVFTALLIAGKMLEDLTISNQDFASIYSFFSLSSVNSLERQFTTALGWKLYISPEQYSDYFFKLQGMIQETDHQLLRKLSKISTIQEES
jgi:Cyclin, N-terminal domain